jgi:Icc-related predicted phosphoesterase
VRRDVVKIVCVSDTHDLPPRDVPDGDILIHAGDLTMMGTFQQIVAAGNWLRSLPHKHKVVICGNHDWLFEKDQYLARHALGQGITYLQDSTATVAGLKFYGSPWTPRCFDWAFNADAEIERYWKRIPEDTDILITHGPPRGVLDMTMRGEAVGCPALLSAVERIKPSVHVFGHIHEFGGRAMAQNGTVFVNAASGYRAEHPPVVLEFDAPAKEAA